MMYNDEFETLPREALKALQIKRLQQVLQRVCATVCFYKKSFAAAKISPDAIRSLEDLKKLPFTTREDLRNNYPFGLFAVPMSNIVRLHASSGTSGRSSVFSYTRRDLDTWTDLTARSLAAAGLTKNDMVHNAFGYGLLPGGLGLHYGIEKIGASVIPISDGNTSETSRLVQMGAYLMAIISRNGPGSNTLFQKEVQIGTLAPSDGKSKCFRVSVKS